MFGIWSGHKVERSLEHKVGVEFLLGSLLVAFILGAVGTAQSTAALVYRGGYTTFLEDCEVE